MNAAEEQLLKQQAEKLKQLLSRPSAALATKSMTLYQAIEATKDAYCGTDEYQTVVDALNFLTALLDQR